MYIISFFDLIYSFDVSCLYERIYEEFTNFNPCSSRKKYRFIPYRLVMIHKSKLFVCPGQCYGISWNICLARQKSKHEACDGCVHQDWQSKNKIGFNPYASSFEDVAQLPKIDHDQYRYPDENKQ